MLMWKRAKGCFNTNRSSHCLPLRVSTFGVDLCCSRREFVIGPSLGAQDSPGELCPCGVGPGLP
jgi:hypothetical protein